jgi:hypothetical protein
VRRRLLLAVVLLFCALVAAAVLRHSFPGAAGDSGPPAGPLDPGSALVGEDLEAQSRELDRQLQSTDAHRQLLDRLSADLIAGRRTLPEAAAELADFSRQHKPAWLGGVGRTYPDRPEEASVAASLVYFTLFGLHDGDPEEEATARRLAADYRTYYGAPLSLPEPAKGAAIPPSRRAAGLDRAEGP